MDKEIEARKLVLEAEKKLKTGFFGRMFSSESSRKEEAIDLYERAGNIFKLCKLWEEAGECFEKCGEFEESLNSDPSTNYQDASHCYKFVDKKSKIVKFCEIKNIF
jgi:alpha-soluble NSF attachment protein